MTNVPLPDADHILRHVKPTAFDNNRVQGAAFEWRRKNANDGLSCNWMEISEGTTRDEKIEYIRSRRRLIWKKSHKLAILNVGSVKAAAKRQMDALGLTLSPDVIHDPLGADAGQAWVADPTHALVIGIPDSDSPQAEAVFDAIAGCVQGYVAALNDA